MKFEAISCFNILMRYLVTHDYDGLYDPTGDCWHGRVANDLVPCNISPLQCKPGYKCKVNGLIRIVSKKPKDENE